MRVGGDKERLPLTQGTPWETAPSPALCSYLRNACGDHPLPPTSNRRRPINNSMASSQIREHKAFFLWNPELQSSQSQTWPRTARVRLSEEVKVILTRIKAQIWTWPDTQKWLIAPHSQLKLSHCTYNASPQCIIASNLLRTQWVDHSEGTCMESELAFQSLLDSDFSFSRRAVY